MNRESGQAFLNDKKKNRRIIEDVSLSQKACEAIKDMIIEGECPMGSRVYEVSLSEFLGVSRSVVREALIALEGEGLLVRNTNRSTIVKEFLRCDVEEIYDLRAVIEDMCLRTAMERGFFSARELREKAEGVDGAFSHSRRSLEWMKQDMHFHEYLVIASKNQYALKVWKSLESQILTILCKAYSKVPEILMPLGRPGDHFFVVDQILAGNTREAVEQLRYHIRDGESIILETYS